MVLMAGNARSSSLQKVAKPVIKDTGMSVMADSEGWVLDRRISCRSNRRTWLIFSFKGTKNWGKVLIRWGPDNAPCGTPFSTLICIKHLKYFDLN